MNIYYKKTFQVSFHALIHSNIFATCLSSYVDPPGSAHIYQLESTAVKRHTVTLSCKLDDLGHPAASKYLWESPTRAISNNNGTSNNQVTTSASVLTMENVSASSEGIYFCAGRNEVGTGPLGHFTLKLNGK